MSVLELLCTFTAPDYVAPWMTRSSKTYRSTCFCVKSPKSELLLVTCYHCMPFGGNVRADSGHERYDCEIVISVPEYDLTILRPISGNVSALRPFKLHEELEPAGEISVVGYPIGGNNVATTIGRFTRLETVLRYGKVPVINMEIDVSATHGNSGGPVISQHGVIGILWGGVGPTSYVIPSVYINRAITTGEPPNWFPFYLANTESDIRRTAFSVDHGAIVMAAGSPRFAEKTSIKVNDVITHVNGSEVSRSCGVLIGKNYVSIGAFLTLFSAESTFDIVRAGKPKRVKFRLEPAIYGIPIAPVGISAEYAILDNRVFVPLSLPLAQQCDFVDSIAGNLESETGSVVIAGTYAVDEQRIPDFTVLQSINGTPVTDIAGLLSAWKSGPRYAVLRFAGDRLAVLDTRAKSELVTTKVPSSSHTVPRK